MSDSRHRLETCPAGPPGVQLMGRGVRFCVVAEAALKVELCIFDSTGAQELRRYEIPECTDGLWHGFLQGAGVGLVYGYRVHGLYDPARGLRFNPNKLLLDPYAQELRGALVWHDALHGYIEGDADSDASFDARDSAPYMPKAVVVQQHFDWQGDSPPNVPWAKTVLYELHVKGFSQQREDLPQMQRGSYWALGLQSTIDYLHELGVTTIELLPIQSFVRDHRLVKLGLTNYWGYNTLAWFAPDAAYGARDDLKWAIRELHKADIEVILDVVYNHSGEGDELGPTLSLRGFGNAEYYRLPPGDERHYVNDTGCGNTLNFQHPRVIQLVMDSLRHWVTVYHVDGFRFDLAVTLGREAEGFDAGAGLFDAMLQDPVLSRVKLIAEPWDLGPGGYQLGRFRAGFAEWNDKSRDDLRRYWRGDAAARAALATRLQGSADRFDHDRRRPWAGINFITAHDGFTLQDVVSYAHKHNTANGEQGRDGSTHNDSANWGVEGATDDAEILAQRARIQRALLATLVFSHGTPMLLAGDEFGHTQQGNNNPYCQDSPLTWLDWSRLATPAGQALHAFTARLLALRRMYPALRSAEFQHGRCEPLPDWPDASWFDERGLPLSDADWGNPQGRLLGLRRVAAGGAPGGFDVLYLLFNADAAPHAFALPPPVVETQLLLDTFDDSQDHAAVLRSHYTVRAHSLVLLAARLPLESDSGNGGRGTGDGSRARTSIASTQSPVTASSGKIA
ncbi:MAG: glycogen debranching protein GlgX [Stagnimonas sp.]|nr:glycogen debranching protein GlgX [Stagnimonas sp.]